MFETLKRMLTRREWSMSIDTDKGADIGIIEFTGNIIDAIKYVIELSQL